MYNEVFFAYQPIFNAAMQPWGYELYYRHNENSEAATFSDAFKATLDVLATAALCSDNRINKARVVVHFSEQAI